MAYTSIYRMGNMRSIAMVSHNICEMMGNFPSIFDSNNDEDDDDELEGLEAYPHVVDMGFP